MVFPRFFNDIDIDQYIPFVEKCNHGTILFSQSFFPFSILLTQSPARTLSLPSEIFIQLNHVFSFISPGHDSEECSGFCQGPLLYSHKATDSMRSDYFETLIW